MLDISERDIMRFWLPHMVYPGFWGLDVVIQICCHGPRPRHVQLEFKER
jgi:hypothetical protein